MSHSSPNWKKPSDIMKKRLVRRRTSSAKAPIHSNRFAVQKGDTLKTETEVSFSKKRQNPFACGGVEKKPKTENAINCQSDENVFAVLDNTNEVSTENDSSYKDKIAELQTQIDIRGPQAIAGLHSLENRKDTESKENLFKTKSATSSKEQIQQNEKKRYCFFPTDWSLKSKVRYISPVSFSWCSPLKTSEESRGISDFVKNAAPIVGLKNNTNSPAAKVEFQKCCMAWMHPHVPWLRLFPRIVSDSKIGKPSAIFHSQEVQKSLLKDWTESFSSAFHMLRSGQCEFFYVCSHQFTLLFRNKPILGVSDEVHALLTPTSRGVREALKKEGVEFSMPLNIYEKITEEEEDDDAVVCVPPSEVNSDNKGIENLESGDCAADNDNTERTTKTDEADIVHTNEGASSWLETLGLDKNKYKSLDPNKVMLQRDTFKMIDNRPESTILVEGANTMALVNFLLNSRSCVPNTGDLAGVPATILAPVAFKGATLKSHQVKQGMIRQQLSNGDIQEGYSVEINGPIFPSNIHNLNQLFSDTQREFSLTCSVQESSTPFNMVCPSKVKEPQTIEKIEEIYLSDQKGPVAIPINDINNGRQAIREMSLTDSTYTWS